MERYQDRQKKLIQQVEEQFRSRPVSLNPATADDFANDRRLALVTLYFVPEEVQQVIQNEIIAPLRATDPAPYYYPSPSLHLTVKNVRYINWPPSYTSQDVEQVRQAFREVTPRLPAFRMKLEGLFEQPASLSVCGFCNETLLSTIITLHQTLQDAGVPDDKKYFSQEIFFGNVSFCRFQDLPNQAFRQKVQELKKIKVGSVLIDRVWLVETDLVCHPGRTIVFEEFPLGPEKV